MAPNGSEKTPRWVLVICAGLSLTQPAAIMLTQHFAPEGAVPTGLHIPDSAIFLHSMDMFANGFESAYATCQAEHGSNSVIYYAMPHLWLHGVLGVLIQILPLSKLLLYGIANGLGAFLYLYAVYRFLQQVIPRQAVLGFLLFALSGGLGGLLYLLSIVLGWTVHTGFEVFFFRFGIYELVEGPHLLPVTHLPRLYYTLALALGFGALTHYHKSLKVRCGAHVLYASLLMLAALFLYLRLVLFILGMVLCFLWAHPFWPMKQRALYFLYAAVPALLGGGAGAVLLRINPAIVENHLRVADMAMWLSPFLTTAFVHLVLAAIAIWPRIDHLPPLGRACAFGAVGYLAVFAVLFAVYQVYYGNVLIARDAAVAARVSDPALLGFVAGAAVAWRRKPGFANSDNWVVLWFLGFLCCAISAFGQGWFLRFGPQRLELLLWLPLCVLAAQGLQRLPALTGKVLFGVLIFLGTISVCVSVLFFQSPLGRVDARGPYAGWHTEVMSVADAAAMDALGDGTVLALPPASDAVVARRGKPVVFGIGTFNLADYPFVPLRETVQRFFDAATSDAEREAIARKWCAHYVYCSTTWPVAEAALEALREAPWLEVVHDDGGAVLFKVTRTDADTGSDARGAADGLS